MADELNAQEAAYFESAGAQTEGLSDASPSSSEPTQPAVQPADPAAQPAGAQQEAGGQQEADRMVPLKALQEERAERKRLRDDMQRMQQQQEALIGRILGQQQPQQAEPAPQIPDFAQDPVGHLRAQNEMLARQLQQVTQHLNGQMQQSQQMTEQQQAQQRVQHFLASDEAKFRTQAPDYDAAAQFLQQSRAAEYRALGMSNPMEINQALQQDVIAMVNIAQRNGTSVAEAAYNLAKARGYKAASSAPQQTAADSAAKLAAIQQGQQQSQSLSQAGGGAAAPLSIDKLLAMSDSEFAKATAGMNWEKMNAELSAR